ncbi:PDZ domain-containing protein MAGIX [Orycteropus afer afer]|uniref:PDZ domain-containing protein MAGIX n=1 Tax=Orycteropus afer afer TaxID=1230840 RepID=A0A8B7B8Q4_ORYAF|nr:PDZ domain-containing protein MAGIX [Orycteropus afer afer]
MEARAGGAVDPMGSKGGRGLRLPASPSARQLLTRLDARPLAARAAAHVAALVRRAGATLRLRSKEGVSGLDSADIEVTDSRLPRASVVGHQRQHCWSETLGTGKTLPGVTQDEASCASKPPQTAGSFCVELIRGPMGFGLTFSGGSDAMAGDVPLAVRGLLKDGPAQRCGRLQAGDLVLRINGESTQGLTQDQVVEGIRSGGPCLRLVLRRPLETLPSKTEGLREPLIRGVLPSLDRSPDPEGLEVRRSRSASPSPLQHPGSRRTAKTRGGPEPSSEAADVCSTVVSPPERLTEDPDDQTPSSPGPWLVPSEERLSRALGVPGGPELALEKAADRRRH